MKRFLQSVGVQRLVWRKPLAPAALSPRRYVPPHIPHPLADGQLTYNSGAGTNIPSDDDLKRHRRACRLASAIREYAGSLVKVGVTTDEIDAQVHEEIIRRGAYPSPLGYNGFPKSLCTSVNQVLCHGIPDARPLEEGDIINLDVSTFVEGFHGDCSGMFVAGQTDTEATELIRVTKQCMQHAIAVCGPGVPYRTIGQTIYELAQQHSFDVQPVFCGHGIGRQFHLPPYIVHVPTLDPGLMKLGEVFTIEPILTVGETAFDLWADGWTVVTRDGSRAAQFEETILITKEGAEILTQHN